MGDEFKETGGFNETAENYLSPCKKGVNGTFFSSLINLNVEARSRWINNLMGIFSYHSAKSVIETICSVQIEESAEQNLRLQNVPITFFGITSKILNFFVSIGFRNVKKMLNC